MDVGGRTGGNEVAGSGRTGGSVVDGQTGMDPDGGACVSVHILAVMHGHAHSCTAMHGHCTLVHGP